MTPMMTPITNEDIMRKLMEMKIASADNMKTLDKKINDKMDQIEVKMDMIKKQVDNKEKRDTERINRMTGRMTQIEGLLVNTLTREEAIKILQKDQ